MGNQNPINENESSGAVMCDALCENLDCVAIIDSGSGLSFVSKSLLLKLKVKPTAYDGPSVCMLSGECFKPIFAARHYFEVSIYLEFRRN